MPLLFALVTEWTSSILSVSIAHSLTNVTLFLVFPFIIGQGMQLQLPAIFPERFTPKVQIMAELPTPAFIEVTATPEALTPTAAFTLSTVPTKTPSVTLTAAQIIVDNNDPGFIREGGEYWETEQGYQGHLVWALTRWKKPDVFITYQPEAGFTLRFTFPLILAQPIRSATRSLTGMAQRRSRSIRRPSRVNGPTSRSSGALWGRASGWTSTT